MMKIYLTGFMAAGKSVLAKKIAGKLQLPCIDLDMEIERFCGNSIAGIFADKGETTFRKMESARLVYVSKAQENFVMACGGGIVEDKHNLYTMQEHGVVIFVKTDVEIIKQRLKTENKERPLLKNVTEKAQNNLIDQLYQSRISNYKKADIVFHPGLESTDDLILDIKSFL
jgi:shikimate kinase